MKPRVFIIDDNAPLRESVGKVLRGAGYEVTTAAGWVEAAVRFVPERIDWCCWIGICPPAAAGTFLNG